MKDILECRGIEKKYKDKYALKGIDLTIEKGKIYGMIGRNGAGKTTLLSMLSAQGRPTAGEVSLNGEKVWENQSVLDKMCFSRELNQMTGIGANTMKVKEYLKMASIYFPGWDKEIADRLVKEFGLDVKKRISKLSKGMLSMVTIIVALSSKAEYTFLDEPVAGLDVVARNQFYKTLLEEYNESGRTFIISTHIIEEAADIFEEVIIINNGELMLKENTQSLLERACHVSGKADVVDKAMEGNEVHGVENTGRSKGATLLLNPGEWLEPTADLSVQPVTLQNLFVALCGGEEQ